MMKRLCKLLLVLLFSLAQNEALVDYRYSANLLFPSFSDPDNVPSDAQLQAEGLGYEDNGPALDPAGVDIPVDGFGYRVFDKDIRYLKCYEVGFCECDPSDPITRNITLDEDPPGDPTTGVYYVADFCMIAPNWVRGASSGMEYRMAYRHVDSVNVFQEHDTDRLNSVVTRAQNQWPLGWRAEIAEIITWKITEAATGATDKFQVIITRGTDGNTYILYLYGSVGTFPATTPVRGFINGEYDGLSDVLTARACASVDGSDEMPANNDLTTLSNFKCGRGGLYLFRTEAGDACLGVTPCVSYKDAVNPNCNRSSMPVDTCTESYSCFLDENNNIVLDIRMKWYKWKSFRAIDYITFIGEANGGTEENPHGVQQFTGPADKCWKDDLPHPDYSDPAVASYTLTMPETSAECGTVIDTTAKTVKFAYKHYNYDPAVHTSDVKAEVDQAGDFIIYGTCGYTDTPLSVKHTQMFNDIHAPTVVAPRSRNITMDVVDRDTADGLVLSVVKIGRDIYLRICFYPGLPFNRHADPYGIFATKCTVANNENFANDLGSFERSFTFIQDRCPVDPPLGPVHLTQAFQADLVYSKYDGTGWCILSGKIDAAKWYALKDGVPVSKLIFKCEVGFCDDEDGLGFGQGFEQQKCVDGCEADNARRRRRSKDAPEQPTETVYTSVTIEWPDDPASTTGDQKGTDSTLVTLIVVIGVVMMIVAIAICGLVYWKLKVMRNPKKRLFEDYKWASPTIEPSSYYM